MPPTTYKPPEGPAGTNMQNYQFSPTGLTAAQFTGIKEAQDTLRLAQNANNVVTNNPQFGAGATTPTPSGTVASNTFIRDELKPAYDTRLTTLSAKGDTTPDWIKTGRANNGTYVGMDGKTYYNFDSTPVSTAAESDDPYLTYASKIMAQTDANTKALIESINKKYEVLRQQQARINESAEKGRTRGLIMAGGQYSPGEFESVLQSQRSFGLQQIGALDAQEDQLIAQAQQAQSEDNMALMEKLLTRAEQVRKEKQAAATKENDAMIKQLQDQRDKLIASSRDSAISGLISQGVTDPNQILQYLNFDDSGKQIGDFTSKEVADTLKNLTVDNKAENLPQDLETFNYLSKNNGLPTGITSLPKEDQYFAYLRMIKGIEKPVGEAPAPLKPGVDATNSVEESMIRTRLFSKLMNIINKGQVSDTDRKIIDERIAQFRDAGMGEQEIMDKLSGFATSVTTPYNNSFRNLIVQNTKDSGTQTDIMGKVSLLLNNGDDIGAMKLVENTAFKEAKLQDTQNYVSPITTRTLVSKVERIRDAIKEADKNSVFGPPGGVISGSLQQLAGRLKTRGYVELAGELTGLYAQWRKELVGSQVTEKELEMLDPLMAKLTDKTGNFMQKLDTFEVGVLDRHNATRNAVGLPEVSPAQVIDDKKRLSIYEDLAPEKEAQKTVEAIYAEDSERANQIDSAINSFFTKFGKQPTYIELLQAFPEWK